MGHVGFTTAKINAGEARPVCHYYDRSANAVTVENASMTAPLIQLAG
jgi:hypothetical protein